MPRLPERRREANALGSGVIVDPRGLVVTNNHVVEKADEITVVLADRREFPAKLMLADPKTDLAVLKIDGGDEPLPAVAMRDSDDLEVGDLVPRSEEHTSELQSLMRISYAVFCLKK